MGPGKQITLMIKVS